MPAIIDNNFSILFVHIPKTGGTSIEDYLQRRFGSISLSDPNWFYKTSCFFKTNNIIDTAFKVSPQHLTISDIDILNLKKWNFCFSIVRNPLDRIISEFKFQNTLNIELTKLGFSHWLKLTLPLAKRIPTLYDNHIRPQVDFISSNCKIFKYEDGLIEVIKKIDELTQNTSNLPLFHMMRSENLELNIKDSDVKLIKKFYEKDYDYFKYN
jgi:hypothetical protein